MKNPVKVDFGTVTALEEAVAESCALKELFLARIIESPQYEEGSKTKENLDFGLQVLAHGVNARLRSAQDAVFDYIKQLKPPADKPGESQTVN